MSTVPEVIVAVHQGTRALGFSVITDSCLPDALEPAQIDRDPRGRAPRRSRGSSGSSSASFARCDVTANVPRDRGNPEAAGPRGARARALEGHRSVPALARTPRRCAPVHLLRGAADRERPPGHPSRSLADAEGRDLPLPRPRRRYAVERKAGWDTHGLPVEVEVEKELKLAGKKAIVEYGIEAFTRRCIESVFRYTSEWEKLTDRIGYWLDLDAAYVTFHEPYIESVWWALKRLLTNGLLYRGHKVVWWWPQGGTALSAAEVGQGYKTVDDPSVVVRFRAKTPASNGTPRSFLSWTTTPWTLPSNVALAVAPT